MCDTALQSEMSNYSCEALILALQRENELLVQNQAKFRWTINGSTLKLFLGPDFCIQTIDMSLPVNIPYYHGRSPLDKGCQFSFFKLSPSNNPPSSVVLFMSHSAFPMSINMARDFVESFCEIMRPYTGTRFAVTWNQNLALFYKECQELFHECE